MIIEFDEYIIKDLDTDRPDLFFRLVEQNRPRLEDFFSGTVAKTMTLEKTNEYCSKIVELRKSMIYIPYVICRNDEYIGLVDLKNINMQIPKAELGYFIDRQYTGRKLAAKALAKVIDYQVKKNKFKKLLCRINAQNKSSIEVALANHFELEGCIRRDYKTTQGELVDLLYYGRIFE